MTLKSPGVSVTVGGYEEYVGTCAEVQAQHAYLKQIIAAAIYDAAGSDKPMIVFNDALKKYEEETGDLIFPDATHGIA